LPLRRVTVPRWCWRVRRHGSRRQQAPEVCTRAMQAQGKRGGGGEQRECRCLGFFLFRACVLPSPSSSLLLLLFFFFFLSSILLFFFLLLLVVVVMVVVVVVVGSCEHGARVTFVNSSRSAAGQRQRQKTNQKTTKHWPLVVRARRVWSRAVCRARLFLFNIIARARGLRQRPPCACKHLIFALNLNGLGCF
jgi:hypothetical protein